MKSAIHVCSDWECAHERPVYTLGDECPKCGAEAINSAPAPFDPSDSYGEYRRRAKRRAGVIPGVDTATDDDTGTTNGDETDATNGDDTGATNSDETDATNSDE